MYKGIVYIVALTNIFVFCNSPKSTSVDSKKPDSMSESIITNIKIKQIDGETGKTDLYIIDSEFSDTIVTIIMSLIGGSEPLRLHLDESEMKELFNNTISTEISFSPPVSANLGALRLTRFLFFTNGEYGNESGKEQTYFFLAYDDNDEFIQSPFVNFTMGDEFQHLQEIIKVSK